MPNRIHLFSVVELNFGTLFSFTLWYGVSDSLEQVSHNFIGSFYVGYYLLPNICQSPLPPCIDNVPLLVYGHEMCEHSIIFVIHETDCKMLSPSVLYLSIVAVDSRIIFLQYHPFFHSKIVFDYVPFNLEIRRGIIHRSPILIKHQICWVTGTTS
jgi:hypothetical protein